MTLAALALLTALTPAQLPGNQPQDTWDSYTSGDYIYVTRPPATIRLRPRILKADLNEFLLVDDCLTIDTTTLVVDCTNNRVGILNATPTTALDVTGDTTITGDLTVDTNTLYVDSANDRIGINAAAPSATVYMVTDADDNVFTSVNANDSAVGQLLYFYRARGTPSAYDPLQANDDLVDFRWFGRNSADAWVTYGRYEYQTAVVTAGAERGFHRIHNIYNGTAFEALRQVDGNFYVNSPSGVNSSLLIYRGGISGSDFAQFRNAGDELDIQKNTSGASGNAYIDIDAIGGASGINQLRFGVSSTHNSNTAFHVMQGGTVEHQLKTNGDAHLAYSGGTVKIGDNSGSDVVEFRSADHAFRIGNNAEDAWKLREKIVSSTQTVNNSTTLVNITNLDIAVEASHQYKIEWDVFYDSNSTADIKFALSVPAGATGVWAYNNDVATLAAGFTLQTNTALSSGYHHRFVAYVNVSTTAGSVALQFAQDTADASNTTIEPGSTIRVVEVH